MSSLTLRWYVDALAWEPTQEEWLKAASCIQKEERERISKFMFKEDSKLAMVGRLLLRKAVNDCCSCIDGASSVHFGRTKRRKPIIESINGVLNDNKDALWKRLQLNISHHGSLVVLATEPRRLVGVDVMTTAHLPSSSVNAFLHDFQMQFSSHEWSYINDTSIDDKLRLKRFYHLWSLKESYIKATGIGLMLDLRQIEFRISNTSVHSVLQGQEGINWRFILHDLESIDHCIAVAVGPLEDNAPPMLISDDVSSVPPVNQTVSLPFTNDEEEEDLLHTPFQLLNVSDILASLKPVANDSFVDESMWFNFTAKKVRGR